MNGVCAAAELSGMALSSKVTRRGETLVPVLSPKKTAATAPSPLWGGWPSKARPGGGLPALLGPPPPTPPHKGEGCRSMFLRQQPAEKGGEIVPQEIGEIATFLDDDRRQVHGRDVDRHLSEPAGRDRATEQGVGLMGVEPERHHHHLRVIALDRRERMFEPA